MQSIFRYPGGKTRKHIREWILSHRPFGVKEYREPFVGGGGIYFAMHDPGVRWINDRHAGLIEVYRALAERPDEFIRLCREVAPALENEAQTQPGPRGTATYPKRLVDVFDRVKLDAECDQAFRYLFVNRTVFAGRVNYDLPSRLYFSNPSGWNVTKPRLLEDAAAHIEGTRITCGDFEPLLAEVGEDVWVYCDPPYAVNTDFSPTSQLYQHGFSRNDHKRFAEAVAKSPHNVCISYDDDPDGFIRELFSDSRFRIVEASWTYCGSTNDKKEIGKELLILNYDPPTTAIIAPEKIQLLDKLEDCERDLLAECERFIELGVRAFRLVGEALRTIRDSGKPSQRLYRETHQNFEDYCRDRWGLGKSQAYRLIDSSSVAATLETSPIGGTFLASERQARELARLGDDKDKLTEVWQAVTEDSAEQGKKITAAFIRDYVDAALDYERPEPDRFKKLLAAWTAADDDARRRFLDEVQRYESELRAIA